MNDGGTSGRDGSTRPHPEQMVSYSPVSRNMVAETDANASGEALVKVDGLEVANESGKIARTPGIRTRIAPGAGVLRNPDRARRGAHRGRQ